MLCWKGLLAADIVGIIMMSGLVCIASIKFSLRKFDTFLRASKGSIWAIQMRSRRLIDGKSAAWREISRT